MYIHMYVYYIYEAHIYRQTRVKMIIYMYIFMYVYIYTYIYKNIYIYLKHEPR